jgi:hypothetical protein
MYFLFLLFSKNIEKRASNQRIKRENEIYSGAGLRGFKSHPLHHYGKNYRGFILAIILIDPKEIFSV